MFICLRGCGDKTNICTDSLFETEIPSTQHYATSKRKTNDELKVKMYFTAEKSTTVVSQCCITHITSRLSAASAAVGAHQIAFEADEVDTH